MIYEERFMKSKIFILAVCSIFLAQTTFAFEQNTCPVGNAFTPETENVIFSAKDIKESCSCSDLVERMLNDRAATYNVLNLTPQQRKCKNEIEKCRYEELDKKINILEQEMYVLKKLQCNPETNATAIKKQEKIIKDLKKDIDKTTRKYDKKFKALLSGEQKAKYNLIQKMKRKDIKRCEKNKPLFKPDPHLQPFGVPYQYDEDVCPKHGIKHLFGRKCKLQG